MSEDVFDFQTLCTPHYQALLNYANRLLPGRPQEARDLVQEAFLRAVRTWPKWRPSTGEDPSRAARGWLHRIVQNVFYDETRATTGHRRLLDDNHHSVVENTYGVEADHNIQLLSDGIGDEVRQALDSLDPDHRAVVERADFGGEKYLAIADSLGIPLGTVMSRLHRGRRKLATALKGYAKNEYGICKRDILVKGSFAQGTKTNIKLPASDRTRATTLADEPAEPPKPQADSTVPAHDEQDPAFAPMCTSSEVSSDESAR